MNIKRVFCIVLVLVNLMGLAGCKKKEEPYPYGIYTRQEVLDLFYQNQDLFDELVDAILADTYFLENGDVHHDGYIGVTVNDERYMELFNERSQRAIRKMLEFKPYMIDYDFHAYDSTEKDAIEITFIGDGVKDEGYSFRYLVDQSDRKANMAYFENLEQDYYVEDLGGGWIFSANVLE